MFSSVFPVWVVHAIKSVNSEHTHSLFRLMSHILDNATKIFHNVYFLYIINTAKNTAFIKNVSLHLFANDICEVPCIAFRGGERVVALYEEPVAV